MRDNDHTASVSLPLHDIGELFSAPQSDPLAGRFETRSGVEQLMDLIEPYPAPLRIELRLPSGRDVPYDESQLAAALAGYAATQISHIDAERARIRRLGRAELAFGVAFLALCLVFSSTISAFEVGPAWLRNFGAEGLVIIGWIALWHPVDMLFFDRVPLVRHDRILRRIQTAQVSVRHHEDDGAPV